MNTNRIASTAQVRYITSLFEECGFSGLDARDWLEAGYKTRQWDELTMEQAGKVIRYLLDFSETKRAGKQKL